MDLIRPRSDKSRIAFLRNALSAAKSDYEKGDKLIFPETFNRLKDFAPAFEEKYTRISQKLAHRSRMVGESKKALKTLETYTKDGFSVLRRQISRLNLPEYVMYMYNINKNRKTPRPKRPSDWLTIARTFIEGDKKAEAGGHPPVASPSAKEIEEKLLAAEKAYAEITPADRDYDNEQAGLAEMRKTANTMIKDILAQLRYTLRNFDVPSRRRIKRSYGAEYKVPEEKVLEEKKYEGVEKEGEKGEEDETGMVN